MAVPESPRSPRALYPTWPRDNSVTDPAHKAVQQFARQLESHVKRTPASDVARRSDVPVSTVSGIVLGTSWPSAVTVAKLEHGVGRRLWRVREQKTRIRPQ